jgi:alpha-tubulin suppressor-like RCC1 family protein
VLPPELKGGTGGHGVVGAAPGGLARADNNSVGTRLVAGGFVSGYAIERDGSLWAWGAGDFGALGLGDSRNHLLPQRVSTGTSWAALAAGDMFCLALKRDGSLWAWGVNESFQLGLGPKNNAPRLRRTRVGSGRWKAIGAGAEDFSVAIRRDGSLWSWGNSYAGELGSASDGSLRRRVGTETDWKAIAVGYDYVLALKRDGSLWSWGGNEFGQLGLGSIDDLAHATPTRVGIDTDWTAISAGGLCSLALKSNGSLWAWGSNAMGELGLGDTVDRQVPTRVGTASNWRAVSADGDGSSFAIKQNASLWAWGNNDSGQLGLGDHAQRHVLTRVGHGTEWTRIAAARNFSLAIKHDGSLWAWGDGPLGLGDTHARLIPTRVTHLP